MSQPGLLKRLVAALEEAGIAYMVTGSVASSYHGEPRSTHDIDVVLLIGRDQIAELARHFPPEEYGFDQVAAVEAIARQDQFQLLEFSTGDKIDFWALSNEDFHRQMFLRRERATIDGIVTWCATAEDLIVQKLSWAQWYESDKQFGDAVNVYEVQFRRLDISHIEKWVATLGIHEAWERLKQKAQPLT